jgi:hypothetical protein
MLTYYSNKSFIIIITIIFINSIFDFYYQYLIANLLNY